MDSSEAGQELAFIKKVIADSRTALIDDGKGLIVFGLLVVVGMVTMYVAAQLDLNVSKLLLWGALIGLGWVYVIIHERQRRKTNRFATFGGRILGSLWLACGIVMTIVGFLTPFTGGLKPWAILPVISLILGIGYLVTGVIHDDTLTRLSAVGWWIGAIVMLLWPGNYMFLMFAGMMILFQIVPGARLFRMWKSQQAGM